MKKLSSIFLAVAFMLSVVGVVFAANPVWVPVPKAPPMAEEQASPAGEKKAPKAKSHEVTGRIDELDAAAGTFSVKGKKGNVGLKAGEKVKLTNFKVGDKVTVKYSDGTATSVKATMPKKSAPKTAEKKAEPKRVAPAAAPAVAPAPAAASAPAVAPAPAAAPAPAVTPAPAVAPAPVAAPDPMTSPDAEKKPAEKL